MSGFERAMLEGKERDELSQIAESLGKKPPARAKKAAMIDLILELAGVTGGSEDEADTDAGADEVAVEETTAEAAPAADDAAGSDDDAAADDDADEDDASDDDAAEATDARSSGRRDADRGGQGRSGRGNQGGQGNQGNQGGGNQDRGQGKQGNQGGGNQGNQGNQNPNQNPNQNQGGQNQGGQNQGGQGDEDGEDGNRRRRRRGRNRDAQPETFEGEPIDVEGLLDLRDDGYGFLRLHGYLPSTDDVYVSVKQVRQFGLRRGDVVTGKSRPASRNEKNPALLQIDAVNGGSPDAARERPRFDDLTPIFPDERLRLEVDGAAANETTRIIDLLAPVGKGQRGLIVAPPKAGKTTIMKLIARSVELNDPEVALFVLLVDERPEEVTDMRRWLINGKVAASTFDRPAEEHIAVAELVIEEAKRLVEQGRDVMIILDGITRLARAYNLVAPAGGRTMSGGIDAAAVFPAKRFFGAARNAEDGGSLTILATALVETGSKMDDYIFEEFKGTGNMELRLDRRLANRRIFPAIDIDGSSTRHEELLFERRQVPQVTALRKVLGAVRDGEGAAEGAAIELLVDRMKTFKTNDDFLAEVAKARAGAV